MGSRWSYYLLVVPSRELIGGTCAGTIAERTASDGLFTPHGTLRQEAGAGAGAAAISTLG